MTNSNSAVTSASTASRKTYSELAQERMASIKAAQAAGAVEKKTTLGNWRRMRVVKNEVDTIKQDRDGQLWRSLRVYGVNGIVLQAVASEMIDLTDASALSAAAKTADARLSGERTTTVIYREIENVKAMIEASQARTNEDKAAGLYSRKIAIADRASRGNMRRRLADLRAEWNAAYTASLPARSACNIIAEDLQ